MLSYLVLVCPLLATTGMAYLVLGSMMDMLLLSMVSIKSVTIGVHSWLPDTMEGPTSVSAVIHAATLVVAGALLVCKVSVYL